jgi:hypothetical protein
MEVSFDDLYSPDQLIDFPRRFEVSARRSAIKLTDIFDAQANVGLFHVKDHAGSG